MNPKILPVIHLLDVVTAKAQALLAREAGADGVFLISHEGGNDLLADLGKEIKTELGMKVGINYLGWNNLRALDVVAAAGLDMLWLDAPGLDSTGLSDDGRGLVTRMTDLGYAAPQVFASVAFKYQPHEVFPEGAARHADLNGFVPTTSGLGTGKPPTIEKIRSMALHAKTLGVASGMDVDNVAEFAPYLTHILVATGVSVDEYRFDFERLAVFIARSRTFR